MGAGPNNRTGPPKKSTQYLDTVVPRIVELLLCCVLIVCIIGILGVTSLVSYCTLYYFEPCSSECLSFSFGSLQML